MLVDNCGDDSAAGVAGDGVGAGDELDGDNVGNGVGDGMGEGVGT